MTDCRVTEIEFGDLPAFGVAFTAEIKKGIYKEEISKNDRKRKFNLEMTEAKRVEKYSLWKSAAEQCIRG